MESILQLLNCCCNKTFNQMIWKLWYFLFFIHFALTANKSQWVAPYFSQRYRVIEWEKLTSTEKNSHLKFQAMCMPCNIHNHLWEVFFGFNSSCTTTPPLRRWVWEGESISLVRISNFFRFMYWAVSHVPVSCWYLMHPYVVCHHFTFSYVAFSRSCCL